MRYPSVRSWKRRSSLHVLQRVHVASAKGYSMRTRPPSRITWFVRTGKSRFHFSRRCPMYRSRPSLTTSSNSPFRRQHATNSRTASSSSAMRSTNCNISCSPRRMAMAKTFSSRVRAKASCRKIDSRVPIFAARWSSLTSPHSAGANSSRMASPTSVRVIVPSKSVRTASLDGIAPFALRLPGSRPFAQGVEVRPLLLRQAIDPDAEALEAEQSDLQIEVRGHRLDAGVELRGVCRQVARRDGLDREAHVHDL